jgi:hypothetical protein
MTTYIILPGGWAGGWQSRQVARLLNLLHQSFDLGSVLGIDRGRQQRHQMPQAVYPICTLRPRLRLAPS